ncbi:gpW family head-tail joining protein [Martelella mediterranea]|uniref:GpW protein n=1 Tax=Martelella mediterranea TaxID=293089 RepID=A0A4R3NEZ5_9HYPH|nr:gpW family head-tail joining protein [Martelella mediterranea]TCT28835.1 gpW protein [Martelella mediterranea]
MAPLTDERLTLETRLGEAKLALHKLETGQSAVTLSYDGESITYSGADRASLRAYIRSLETQLGLRRSGRPRGRGVIFG